MRLYKWEYEVINGIKTFYYVQGIDGVTITKDTILEALTTKRFKYLIIPEFAKCISVFEDINEFKVKYPELLI